jgi:hypothetical protein
MKVGDLVEFRCPDVFMEKGFESRGVGIIIGERLNDCRFDAPGARIAVEVQWSSGEVSWEHDTYLEKL